MSKHCWTLKDRYESQFSAAFYPIMLSDTKRAEIIHRADIHVMTPEELARAGADKSELEYLECDGWFKMATSR